MMSVVRVTRALLTNFRGWKQLDLRPGPHVLLAGVPRAGRSDLITALTRVLAADTGRGAELADLHQQSTPSPTGTGGPSVTRAEHAEVEVTVTDLDPDVQQHFDGYLEPLDPSGQVSEDDDADPDAPLCVRMTYRVAYDPVIEEMDAFVYLPVRSKPALGQFVRVAAATRRALPVITLHGGRPLQIRAGGSLRRIAEGLDADGVLAAFDSLGQTVDEAVNALSGEPAVSAGVQAVLDTGGTGVLLGDRPVTTDDIGFIAEDGSVPALLRRLHAAVQLDDAGLMPLTSHGSTATAVLSAAEAMRLAAVPGAVILADDFGDQLDAATAEHLAALLRASSGQVWLSTRRPEVARAFEPVELIRLVRHGGTRSHHRLATVTDHKALSAMRQLHTQLMPALSGPVVAITEGPHDVAALTFVDRRYPPQALPLSAHGVRLVAAGTGQDGGIDQIPRVAELSRQLGFRVLAIIDCDKDNDQTAAQLAKVEKTCDAVVRLPRGAIERASMAGIALETVAAASAKICADYGMSDPMATQPTEAGATLLCKLIHKKGLHEQFLAALYDLTGTHPPMLKAALDSLAAVAAAGYAGTSRVDLPDIERPAPAP